MILRRFGLRSFRIEIKAYLYCTVYMSKRISIQTFKDKSFFSRSKTSIFWLSTALLSPPTPPSKPYPTQGVG